MKNKILHQFLYLAFLSIPAFAGTDSKEMTATTPSVRAGDAGFYLGMDGGVNFAQNPGTRKILQTQTGLPSSTVNGTGSDSVGAVGGLKVGYNFESYGLGSGFGLQPAVEAEAYYLNSYTKQIYPAIGSFPTNGYRAQYNDGAFMLNGLVRFKTGTLLTPYLGAGIGAEYISNSAMTIYDPTAGLKLHLSGDNDTVFAVQGLAGLNVNVARHWDIFSEYKFIAGIDPVLNNSVTGGPVLGTAVYNAKYEPGYIGQHSITVGLKYNF